MEYNFYESLKAKFLETEKNIEKAANQTESEILSFLEDRLKMIEAAYSKELTEKQFKQVQREEEMIKITSHFMNDCRSLTNIYKNAILGAFEVVRLVEGENILLKQEIRSEGLKNRELIAFLKEHNIYEQYLLKATIY